MIKRIKPWGEHVVDLEAVRARLEAFLGATHDGPVAVTDLAPLAGGYSLVTIRFTATTSSGAAQYVLRADPPPDATMNHTDRAREWELLAALTGAGAVPMPAARWADTTGELLGSPAIILDYVEGRNLLAYLGEIDQSEHTRVAFDLAETIGTVHLAGEAVVPATFERPGSWDAYIDGFVEGWRNVERSHCERDPFIRWVAGWLDSHRPLPAPLTLVHGEFQTSNVMVDASGAMHVIDWEYAHVGDPRVDLGWLQSCAAFMPPDLIGLDPMGFCRRYCEVTGLSEDVVNPLTVAWFAVASGHKALGGMLDGIASMAAGTNHVVTSAYLLSAMSLTHRMWRENVRGLEVALAMTDAPVEVAS
jgi:aminoglycoside phosphotransferase (APT) family kinase protein